MLILYMNVIYVIFFVHYIVMSCLSTLYAYQMGVVMFINLSSHASLSYEYHCVSIFIILYTYILCECHVLLCII